MADFKTHRGVPISLCLGLQSKTIALVTTDPHNPIGFETDDGIDSAEAFRSHTYYTSSNVIGLGVSRDIWDKLGEWLELEEKVTESAESKLERIKAILEE